MTQEERPKGIFASLKGLASVVAGEGVHALVQPFEGQVDVDLERGRVMLSDALLGRMIRRAALESPEIELLDFDWDGAAYRCRVRAKERVVVVRITPEHIRWSEGLIEFRGSTPEPPVIEDAPVGNWLMARFTNIFGGTDLGTKVLSSVAPEGLSWSGQTVTWRRPLDGAAPGLAGMLAGAPSIEGKITHDARGMWMTVSGGRSTLLPLVGFLAPRMLSVIRAKFEK